MIRFPPLEGSDDDRKVEAQQRVNSRVQSAQNGSNKLVESNTPLPPHTKGFHIMGLLERSTDKAESKETEHPFRGLDGEGGGFYSLLFQDETNPITMVRAQTTIQKSRHTASNPEIYSNRAQTAPGLRRGGKLNRFSESVQNRSRPWTKDPSAVRKILSSSRQASSDCLSNSLSIEMSIREAWQADIWEHEGMTKVNQEEGGKRVEEKYFTKNPKTLRVYIEQVRKAVSTLPCSEAAFLALDQLEGAIFSPNWKSPCHEPNGTTLCSTTYAQVLEELEERYSQVLSQNTELQGSVSKLENECETLKFQVTRLCQETERCQNVAKTKYMEIKQLETKVKHLNNSNSDYIDDFRDLERRFAEHKDLYREKCRENEKLLNKLISTQTVKASLEQDMMQRLQTIRDLEAQVKEIQSLKLELKKARKLNQHVKEQHRKSIMRQVPSCLSRVGSDTNLLQPGIDETYTVKNTGRRRRSELNGKLNVPKAIDESHDSAKKTLKLRKSESFKERSTSTSSNQFQKPRPRGTISKEHEEYLEKEFGSKIQIQMLDKDGEDEHENSTSEGTHPEVPQDDE